MNYYNIMKRLIITSCILSALLLTVCANAQNLPSKWKLTKANKNAFEQLWENDSRHITATECGNAYIEAPNVKAMKEGECITFHIPVKDFKAGSCIEFDIMLGVTSPAHEHFHLEYFDNNGWQLRKEVKCVGGRNEPAFILETIRFNNEVKDGEVLIRLRAAHDFNAEAEVKLMPYGYIGGYIASRGLETPKDTLRLGYLGNSFTFVNSADFILKEIAWKEGHYLDMNVNAYPGAYFRSHLALEGSMDVISHGGYDWFILQDQSTQAARFGRDSTTSISDYTKTISKVIRYFAPQTRILLEQTWAFSQDNYGSFGSFEEFDRCSGKGVAQLSKLAEAEISPIAKAFAIIRAERPDIEIYSTDFHHPAAYGAYVKACVNYLMIFRTKFNSDKADFALDPATCAYLRSVAERVVLE